MRIILDNGVELTPEENYVRELNSSRAHFYYGMREIINFLSENSTYSDVIDDALLHLKNYKWKEEIDPEVQDSLTLKLANSINK